MEKKMTYAEFMESEEYRGAGIIELYDSDGTEIDYDVPDEDLAESEVLEVEAHAGYVSVVIDFDVSKCPKNKAAFAAARK